MLTGNTFEIGHLTNRSGGRERVYVILRCVHGEEDAPREYITEHYEYDRLDLDQRGSVIEEAVTKHRENLLAEHRVRCDCQPPAGFTIAGPYRAAGILT